MEPDDLQLAADFCKQVGAPHLLTYLGVEEGQDPAEARSRLKARRKFMQGMQGNPKYKKEALLLIKHFNHLNAVLEDPKGYVEDARRRSESEHLPVLEMTIRGVLAAGSVTPEQENYLRRNALELGVSELTFRELMSKLSAEVSASSAAARANPAARPAQENLYLTLGVPSSANAAEIQVAWEQRVAELPRMRDRAAAEELRRRLDTARQVLSNEASRRAYDLAEARTGPPARARAYRPDQAATALPMRSRDSGPSAQPAGDSRLEIVGGEVRRLKVGPGMMVTTIVVRNAGDGPMGGAVAADASWAVVDPKKLDPAAREQTLSVQIDPNDLPRGATSTVVTIQTDRGERGRVLIELQRGAGLGWIAATIAVLLVLAFSLVAVVQWLT